MTKMLHNYALFFKGLALLIMMNLSFTAYCQVTVLEKSVYLLDEIYDLKVQKKEATEDDNTVDYYVIKAKQGEKESKEIELRTLDKEIFEAALKKGFLEVTKESYLNNGTPKTGVINDKFEEDFKNIINTTYSEILVAAIKVAEYEPIAGEMYVHDKIRAFTNSNSSRTEHNYYKVKNLPLLIKSNVQFQDLKDNVDKRFSSLTNFKSYLAEFEKSLSELKRDIGKLSNLKRYPSETDIQSAVEAFRGKADSFNDRIADKRDAPFDNDGNISFTFLYPEIALNELYYKNKQHWSARLEGVTFIINNDLRMFSFSQSDIDDLQKSLIDFKENLAIEETSYNKLQQQISEKKESIDTLEDVATINDVKKEISELEQGRQNLISTLNKSINELNSKFLRSLSRTLEVNEVEIEFNEGFIENITVRGHLYKEENRNNNAPLEFTNNYPIGFSSKKDFDNLAGIRLFEKRSRSTYNNLYILLDQIFDYNYNLDLNTKDYSPQNGVKSFKIADKTLLTKIQSSKILEAKVFTDLVGIDSKKPNGLIQTEISRRVNLRTKRVSFGDLETIANKGYFAYVEPVFVVSKIEEDNRRLTLRNDKSIVNGQAYDRNYVSTLKLKEYQHMNIGVDVNFFVLDLPMYKSTFLVNGAIRFGRTALLDTTYRVSEGVIKANDLINPLGVSTLEYYPEIVYKLQPERRYGFSFSYRHTWFKLLNSDVIQVTKESDYDRGSLTSMRSRFNTYEILGFLNPNKTDSGRLFFRYRFYYGRDDSNTNFYQAQLGYSFYLLSRNQPKRSVVN